MSDDEDRLEQVRNAFSGIKRHWLQFILGIPVGMAIMLLISQLALNLILFLQLMTLLIVVLSWFKKNPLQEKLEESEASNILPSNSTSPSSPSPPAPKPRQYKVKGPCPECHSTARHRKGCSLSPEGKKP